MDVTFDGEVVRAGQQAREQFYDARGYGRPVDGGALELSPVEAAHLLARGDLATVEDMDFASFLASRAVSEVQYFVYADLRDRGFYLSPAGFHGRDHPEGVDFVVYPRGEGPWDDDVAYHVRVRSERASIPASALGECVLAVVDEESEITYLETDRPSIDGTSPVAVPPVEGDLLADRVLCRSPPPALHESAFYGQRIDGEDGAVQLSLVEATFLAARGTLSIDGGEATLWERGRSVEGERFERRYRVYETLRAAGVAPKTGFKFGADFRTYADVDGIEDLGHSELLVRVLAGDHVFEPRNLALDVRLAHGVRKKMAFALVDEDVSWLSVERLRP